MQAVGLLRSSFYKLRYRCNRSKQNSNNKQVSLELASQCRSPNIPTWRAPPRVRSHRRSKNYASPFVTPIRTSPLLQLPALRQQQPLEPGQLLVEVRPVKSSIATVGLA